MAPRRQKTSALNIEAGELQSTGREQGVDLARRLHDLVREHPDFQVLQEPTTDLYCFRYVPNGLAERQEESAVRTLLDSLNLEIMEAVRRCGRDLVEATRVGGRAAISVSVCSQGATEGDVEAAFEAVARWGRLLTKTHSVSHGKPAETEAL